MPQLFDAMTPRDEVLAGTLTDAVFAASLDDVVEETGPKVYRDAAAFFSATYPSAGLRTLLNESLGRAGGAKPESAPVIRLETNLGGGKTHNLIALYHAARGRLDQARAGEFMDVEVLPEQPIDQVAVLVGTGPSATGFPTADGITPQTVWGHLALQLGGVTAYEAIQREDQALQAPGANQLKRVIGGRPTLILLDELARYLVTARGTTVGGTTLDQQTTSFLMALMEAVDREPAASLVITMTETTDPFGGATEQMLDTVAEARELMARRERVLRPSDEADLPQILARRLFKEAAEERQAAAEGVGHAYAEMAAEAAARGADLPEQMAGAGFATDVARTHPFHPDLVRVLDKRLSTIPSFHRTRGALRLLARTVRRLWEERPPGTALIHLHHIDLGDRDIAEDLSSRLDRPKWEPVIRADVASGAGGEPSHAEVVDQRMGADFARRLATAAYLFSLTHEVPGVPSSDLLASVLTPGDDPALAARALDLLEQSAWYLHSDPRGLRFSTEVALPKMIADAEREVTTGQASRTATDILARQFRDAALKVRRTWEGAKVPDRADEAQLVLLHWDELQLGSPEDPTPQRILDTWQHDPAGGHREFRNRLVFLAPLAESHEQMLVAVRRHLALDRLAGSTERLRDLSDERRAELKQRAKESELEARVAVCNHVSALYVPQGQGLEGRQLDLVTQASLKPNQTDAVLDYLAAAEKTLTPGSKPLDPARIKSKLGRLLEGPLATSELVGAFARRPDLKLVLDRKQLVDLVAAGVRNGAWEYQDPELGQGGWGTKDRPAAGVRLDAQTLLHPTGSAPAPVVPACPLCGQVHPPGPCPGKPPPLVVGSEFRGSGAAAVALAQARQEASDAGRGELRSVRVSIDPVGDGTALELARLLAFLPTTTPGAELSYRVEASVSLNGSDHSLQVDFNGTPKEYDPLRAALDQILRNHQASLRATIEARFAEPLGLGAQELGDLRQRAQDAGPSACAVTLVTEANEE